MTKNNTPKILLASASSRRVDLLQQINVAIDKIVPADIDETPLKHEKPASLAVRLSQEKARAVHKGHSGHYVLAADTVVACGQNVLDKAENAETALKYIEKLSGRRHHVHGGITLITPEGHEYTRHCKTLVQFAPLERLIIADYIESGEWKGKAGGYAIQGAAGAFVKYMAGSYSNVVGLSLYDTMKILQRAGLNARQ